MDINVKSVSKTRLLIEGEIPASTFESYRKAAGRHLGEHMELPGFRKGHIPENVLVDKLGPMAILEQMAEMAIRDEYPKILVENEIAAVGRPEVSITKIAADNPLSFKITQDVLPEFKLPDYREIARKVNAEQEKVKTKIEVTSEELENILVEIKKTNPDEELDDEKKNRVKENLVREKELRAKDKHRIALIEAILKDTAIDVPDVLVERQMDRFIDEMRVNLSRMQVNFEEYLKKSGKTEEAIREASREDANKRVRTQLLLEALAKEEKIELDEQELERETSHILDHYKNADREAARDYVAGVMRNTRVFDILEKL